MPRPALLFVTPYCPLPPFNGGAIRTVEVLRGLKADFEVTLASAAPPRHMHLPPELVTAVADRYVTWPDDSPARPGPLMRWRYHTSHLPFEGAKLHLGCRQAPGILAELLKRTDLLVANFAVVTSLLPPLGDVRRVLSVHNVEPELMERRRALARSPYRRMKLQADARKMTVLEERALRGFDAVVAMSERDRAELLRRYGVRNIVAVPNGVDLDYFAFLPPGAAPADGGTVVFTGTMDWPPNADGLRWFLETVWPRILARRPRLKAILAGTGSARRLMPLVQAHRADWTFTGRVPDIRPFVHQAQVAIVPLRIGSGTRIKIYEAMAMGCPVVSTTIGAEGLPIAAGRHYLQADEPDAFADAVLRLLDDAQLRAEMARAGRAYVEAFAPSATASARFAAICQAVLEGRFRPDDPAPDSGPPR